MSSRKLIQRPSRKENQNNNIAEIVFFYRFFRPLLRIKKEISNLVLCSSSGKGGRRRDEGEEEGGLPGMKEKMLKVVYLKASYIREVS